MNRAKLPRLHAITDTERQSRFGAAELARLAAAGGADAIQFRDKRPLPADEAERQLREIRGALGQTAALIVNDRLDLAAVRNDRGERIADGLHLGRHDASAQDARARLGEAAWIGRTANDLEEARTAAALPVDYLGVGPVFGTRSKANPAPKLGLARLREIVEAVSVPVIAIGGIRAADVADVMATGCHGIAVLSEIVCVDDPEAAAAEFRRAVDAALGELPERSERGARGGD